MGYVFWEQKSHHMFFCALWKSSRPAAPVVPSRTLLGGCWALCLQALGSLCFLEISWCSVAEYNHLSQCWVERSPVPSCQYDNKKLSEAFLLQLVTFFLLQKSVNRCFEVTVLKLAWNKLLQMHHSVVSSVVLHQVLLSQKLGLGCS